MVSRGSADGGDDLLGGLVGVGALFVTVEVDRIRAQKEAEIAAGKYGGKEDMPRMVAALWQGCRAGDSLGCYGAFNASWEGAPYGLDEADARAVFVYEPGASPIAVKST